MPGSLLRTVTLLLLALMALPAPAVEEPRYEVLRQLGSDIELRRYPAYVVAEVTLNAPAAEAGNQAFPILAGYIFGKNQGQRQLEMTAPVIQAPAPTTLAMTAPVTQSAAGTGTRVQFVLPAGVTLATAPRPVDDRVQLREQPATTWAVIRYSGTWSQERFDEHLALLRSALAAEGIATEGEPVWARYNPPITPWFMRRNEVWLHVTRD